MPCIDASSFDEERLTGLDILPATSDVVPGTLHAGQDDPIAGTGYILLHDDCIGALRDHRSCKNAQGRIRRKCPGPVARRNASHHCEDRAGRQAISGGQGVAIHSRLVEWRERQVGGDSPGQDLAHCLIQDHLLMPLDWNRPSRRPGPGLLKRDETVRRVARGASYGKDNQVAQGLTVSYILRASACCRSRSGRTWEAKALTSWLGARLAA